MHNGTMLLFTVETQMEKTFLPPEKHLYMYLYTVIHTVPDVNTFYLCVNQKKNGFRLVDWHFGSKVRCF